MKKTFVNSSRPFSLLKLSKNYLRYRSCRLCSVEKVILQILQNSQEKNTCATVLFLNKAAGRLRRMNRRNQQQQIKILPLRNYCSIMEFANCQESLGKFIKGNTNVDLKICQYLRLHKKIIYAEDFTLKHLFEDFTLKHLFLRYVHVRHVKSSFTNVQKQ